MDDFTIKKSIVTLAMAFIGIAGNIISFIIFSRKTFRKNSISIYCRALAIFDMYIITSAVRDFYYILYKIYILNSSDAVCAFYGYAYYSLGSIPGWILVAFSVERTLSLKKVKNGMKKSIVHFLIVITIVISHLLLYIGVVIYIRLIPVPNSTAFVCDTTLLSYVNIIYIIESNAVPFLIMLISSLYTIKMLRDSRRHVEAIGSMDDKRKSRNRKFAITSITFNVLFIVLKTPLLICISIGYYNVNYYLYQISLALFFLNFSISFFVHFFTNSIFRRELHILLRIRKTASDSTLQPNPTNRTINQN